ncbi:MAG: alanine racemase [Alphaproteobacteria bacterium]|jgi:alanine racemase
MALLTTRLYLDNLVYNYRMLQKKSPQLAAVVKANAYGLGALKVTQCLSDIGCTHFFVATADEGKALRQAFANIIIYVLDGFIEQQTIIDYHLRPVLNTLEQLNEFQQVSCPQGSMLHIDTGMNRLGILMSDLDKIDKVALGQTKIDYVMTHFSDCETNQSMTDKQADLLTQAANILSIKNMSLCNSAGIMMHDPKNPNVLGRAGIALYGGVTDYNLKPVVSVYGHILQKKQIPSHEPVGYGATYITKSPTKLITVAGGYADGILRGLSGGNYCGFCEGYLLPLVGRVSMDTTIFDATALPLDIFNHAAQLEFFGLNNPITHIAECADTIAYEFLTNLSKRSKIKFFNQDQ